MAEYRIDDEPEDKKTEQDAEISIVFTRSESHQDHSRYFYLSESLVLFLLSALAIASVIVTPLDEAVSTLSIQPLLNLWTISLVLLPLPVAYAATISRKAFRYESLVPLLLLPGGVASGAAGYSFLFIPIAGVLASYKAPSIYNGKNSRWITYKTGSVLVVAAALIVGGSIATDIATNTETRDQLKETMVDTAVNISADYAKTATAQTQQQDQFSQMTEQTALQASKMAIEQTQQQVFSTINSTDSFTTQQVSTIGTSFRESLQTVPSSVSSTMREELETNLEQQQANQQRIKQLVRPKINEVITPLFDKPGWIALGIGLAIVSIIFTLKIPLQLLTLVYGSIIVAIHE